MHKGELPVEKNVVKYYSPNFTGGELKQRDACLLLLLFAQGYNGLSDLLKRV